MKAQSKFTVCILTIVVALMSLLSCNDDNSDEPIPPDIGCGDTIVEGVMCLKVDGETKSFIRINEGTLIIGNNGLTRFFSIATAESKENSFPQLSIQILEGTKAGTYDYPFSFPAKASLIYSESISDSFYPSSGSITIISHDTINERVIGKFNMKVTNRVDSSESINLTEGQFNLSYSN